MKKQAGRKQQARSGHGIILSDSDSDSDTDMGGSDRALRPAHSRAPSLRAAPTIRHRQGRAGTGRAGQRSHSQGRADDMDWETEAAELAEEEATLDVSLPFTDLSVSLCTCFFYKEVFCDPIQASPMQGGLHTLSLAYMSSLRRRSRHCEAAAKLFATLTQAWHGCKGPECECEFGSAIVLFHAVVLLLWLTLHCTTPSLHCCQPLSQTGAAHANYCHIWMPCMQSAS